VVVKKGVRGRREEEQAGLEGGDKGFGAGCRLRGVWGGRGSEPARGQAFWTRALERERKIYSAGGQTGVWRGAASRGRWGPKGEVTLALDMRRWPDLKRKGGDTLQTPRRDPDT
jgi:hypothetical protein